MTDAEKVKLAGDSSAASADKDAVAVLMATWNGAAFLDEQIVSLARQTHPSVDLWVSDDGSGDQTPEILADWQRRWKKGRFEIVSGPQRGFAENFRALITNDAIKGDYFAFCDQDDIWDPCKLQKAIDWMRTTDGAIPLLFCSRTTTVSEAGEIIGMSPLFERPPSFANALVQSIAGGNTMVMNRAARDVLASASERTTFVSHDWWAYMVVCGVGGRVHYCAEPLVRYRQHAGNQVGANTSWGARLNRLRRLFGGQFQRWTNTNLCGLEFIRDVLTPEAAVAVDSLARARSGGPVSRLRHLHRAGVYRQTTGGTMMLWAASIFGRI